MDEQLKNGLLAQALHIYEIGYLLLSPELIILKGNQNIGRWLERPLDDFIGRHVTEALPELFGVEEVLTNLTAGVTPFCLEEIYRTARDGAGEYFDLQVTRLSEGDNRLLLTTADVTRKARQEFLLQQQRNEVQLLSAELTAANERLSYILKRLVPAPVAQSLIQNRRLPKPGGEVLREATILFADMRDFTVYAEVYQPSDTLEFLNTYLAVVAEAILRHEGSLIQLVGDMVMGVFNIPEPQSDHAMRAIRAAIDIQDSLKAFNASADSRFPDVSFGVGIGTGPIIAGYLGVQQRFRYAVVGDTTNVAFHLSSLAAPGRILLGEMTVRAAGDAIVVREKGEMQLKRRRKLVKVYELNSINSTN
jgi:adenylate cyclase